MNSHEWSGKGWKVTVTDTELVIDKASCSVTISSVNAGQLDVRRRWFRRRLYDEGQSLVCLRGITKIEAAALSRALRHLPFAVAISDAVAWCAAVRQLIAEARTEQRWIATEAVDALVATRPEPGLLNRVRTAGYEPFLTTVQLEAAGFLDAHLESLITDINEQIMASELSSRRIFFDTIEKTPLTDEQARAVVCFDNRVQVLAAAGSGKTSVMVARAAYAVSRGFVAPAASFCWRSTRML